MKIFISVAGTHRTTFFFGDGAGQFDRVGREGGIDTANHIKQSETDIQSNV